MEERVFFESEVLPATFEAAIEELGLKLEAGRLIGRMTEAQADALNDDLIGLLGLDALSGAVQRIEGAAPPGPPTGLGFRIRKAVKDGTSVKMTFFRVQSSWATAAVYLVGLGIGIALVNPGATAPAAGLLKTVWENLVTLERPKDDFAIDAYEALLRAQIPPLDTLEGAWAEWRYPTMARVHEYSLGRTSEEIAFGLKRLSELKLADVKAWAAQAGDYTQPQNCWTHLL